VENQKIKAEGTGIGLNLAKLIVRMHRGKIWVESEPNKGSNFSFCIPNKLLCNMDEMPKE
jgi:signal transduction histidine kinase